MNLAVYPSSDLKNHSIPTIGTDTAVHTETHVAPIHKTMDFIWQWNVVGNVDPASTAGTSNSKITTINYHTLALSITLTKS